MATVNQYRVYCNNDAQYEYVWGTVEPTDCPFDPVGHTIDASQTTIVDTVSQAYSTTSTGELVTSATYGTFTEDTKFKGIFLQASGVDTDTFEDQQITTEIYLHSGWFWSNGGAMGDYLEMSVVDKDDVLGLFSTYGLVSGVDTLELSKYAETIYINPAGSPTIHLSTPDAAPVATGLYIRTKAHTTSDTKLSAGVVYQWFEV